VSDEIDQESELVVPSVEDGAHEREADGQRAEEDLRRRHVALGLLLVAADHRDGEDQKEGAKELDQERRDRAQMMQKVIERVPAATSLRADGHGGLLVACCLRERERENGSKDRSRCRSIAISTEEQLRCLRSWFLRLFRLFRLFRFSVVCCPSAARCSRVVRVARSLAGLFGLLVGGLATI